jgi:outer membrane protein
MEQAPQAQLASEEMKQRFADREKGLLAERDSISKLEKQYKRDKETISSTKREEMEQRLRGLLRDYKRDSDNFTEDFNLARNEALDKLQSDVYKAIVSVAEKEKYDLVLSESVLYASSRMDITDKVLAELITLSD